MILSRTQSINEKEKERKKKEKDLHVMNLIY